MGSEQTPGHVCTHHFPVHACVMYASSDAEVCGGRGWSVVVWARHGVWMVARRVWASKREPELPRTVTTSSSGLIVLFFIRKYDHYVMVNGR